MSPVVENVLCSIVASIICDVGKISMSQLKLKKADFDKKMLRNLC